MRLLSRDGVFRPFDPNSALLAGSSGVAGAFGEGVSNMPTGLFGLGAVSRLVNYMKEIEYDKIAIHLVRDASRDVQIREYVVQSPEILMTGDRWDHLPGRRRYRRQSPVHGGQDRHARAWRRHSLQPGPAADREKDDYGYWKGPVVKVWGTIAGTKSNLDDIISDAGRGAVLGGITRPISGLWGNLKYWWFGGGKKPAEYEKP